MVKHNVKLPTLVGILKLADAVEYHTTNGDDLDELMFYANRGRPLSNRTVVNVVKPHRAQLKKFKAATEKYIQAMETVLAHLEANGSVCLGSSPSEGTC